MSDGSAAQGIMVAIEVLSEQLIKSGAIDRDSYISELKFAYNTISQSQSEEYGGQLLHTLIRHIEKGPVRRS